jgi:HPt (histidine-containing phosphotransfer) domain-containing protein
MDPLALGDEAAVVDLSDLVDRCMGNLALVERIVAKIETNFDSDLAQLEAAILDQNNAATASVAHRLKGASANVSAQRLRWCAEKAETLARQGCLSELGTAIQSLRSERSRFNKTLASMTGDPPAPCCRPDTIAFPPAAMWRDAAQKQHALISPNRKD